MGMTLEPKDNTMKSLTYLSLLAFALVFVGCSATDGSRLSSVYDDEDLKPFPDMSNMQDGFYDRIQDPG